MPRVSEGEVDRGGAAACSPARIAAQMERLRGRTLALIEPLNEAALRRRVRDFLSPLLWDLGHIADFERLWLVDAVRGRAGDRLRREFDAQETPRQARNGDSLPGKEAAVKILERVRGDSLRLLESVDLVGDDELLRRGFVYRMVLQHEAQHQETMLQALDIPADEWGYCDATLEATVDAADKPSDEARWSRSTAGGERQDRDDEDRVRVPSGAFVLGTEDRSRAYDNERRSHEIELDAFDIERFPVTNRRWLCFMDDGGYRRHELWSPEGAAWRRDNAVDRPQGWAECGGEWRVRRFGSEHELQPSEPVQHVSFWEAEAFAAWSGARLPEEAEWEKAVSWDPRRGAGRVYPWGDRLDAGSIGSGSPGTVALESSPDTAHWHPPPVGKRPDLASAYGVEDALGSVYQWTSSPFRPYPGFEAFPYSGYSEVFFGDTYRVLRGASWAADEVLWRTTYRNWDFPQRRQIFAGVRLVYDP